MLSRRNIRIKVMQVLYAMNRDANLTLKDGKQLYWQSIERSFDLYLYNLLQLYKIAGYSLKEYDKRQAKLLPTEADKQFSTRLWDNPLIQSLHDNPELSKMWKNKGLTGKIDQDNTRLFYNELAKTEAYSEYLKMEHPANENHKKILMHLYKVLIKNEPYNDLMEDHFSSWFDDESLIIGAMKKTIKALPEAGRFFEEFRPEDEAVKDFGEELLQLVIHTDEALLEVIKPNLQNWDAERVAVLDMILLKMAVSELLHFPTIPTKVTLNEFVEISKLYSTDKSKDFINGILDRLMKQLMEAGRINKEGRGLVE